MKVNYLPAYSQPRLHLANGKKGIYWPENNDLHDAKISRRSYYFLMISMTIMWLAHYGIGNDFFVLNTHWPEQVGLEMNAPSHPQLTG